MERPVKLIDARVFDSAQVVYNMLNPSVAAELPPNYPAQDYGRLFNHTRAAGVGARSRRLLPLIKEGFAVSLTEAATRFAISLPAMGTILVGMATPQQFEDALAAVQKGRLPPAALGRLSGLLHAFAGEPR
jgi:aryl-alcohol dehydrogenase-like predicted oxidoreductase